MDDENELPPLSAAERADCDMMNTRLCAAMDDPVIWQRLQALSNNKPPRSQSDERPIAEVAADVHALMDEAGVPRMGVPKPLAH